MTPEGKPYAPIRYREIVKERYIISNYTHTSYEDLKGVTPLERKYLIDFIKEDIEHDNELKRKAIEKARNGN